jgi:GT2 family glycosyltransferase
LIDLIIVNYKSTDYLQTCLASIYAALNGFKANVHVFDNGSNDHVNLIQENFPQAMLIKHRRNLGFSRAVNRLLTNTSSPYIVILNPDTIINDGFFEFMTSFMASNPNVGIAGPKINNPDGSIQGSARSFPTFHSAFFGRSSLLTKVFPNNRITHANILTKKSDGITPMDVDWVCGACMVVRREALDDVGLLDERFFLYWEDADWCKRMWQKDWRVTYCPKVAITHYAGGSSERNLFQSVFEFHRSAYRYFNKYFKSYSIILKPAVFLGLSFRFLGVLIINCVRRSI